jgi:hypothetical protein
LSNLGDEKNTYRAEIYTQAKGALLVYDGAREAGVYRLQKDRTTVWYVVPADPRESDLTPCSAADRERISKLIGARDIENTDELLSSWSSGMQRQELWLYLLLLLLGLLCFEVWMTRRLVMRR